MVRWLKRRRAPEPSKEVCVEWLERAPMMSDTMLASLSPNRRVASIDSLADSVWNSWQGGGGKFVDSPLGSFKFKDFGSVRLPSGLIRGNEMPHLFEIDHRDALRTHSGPDGGFLDWSTGSIFRLGEDSVVIVWSEGPLQNLG